jgi:hypothetical protein
MTAILWAWVISFAAMSGLALLLGRIVRPAGRRSRLGILVDNRGRCSLTHLQLVLWSLLILSLISGVFWGKLIHNVKDPLGFSIPDQVLGLLGISVGSAVTATAVKASNDHMRGERIPVGDHNNPPRLAQIFLLEEGAYADEVIDVTKFQNFVITVVLIVAYIGLACHTIVDARTAAAVTTLPSLSSTFLILVGISQAGYVAGKLPPQTGVPANMTTVATRNGAGAARPAPG